MNEATAQLYIGHSGWSYPDWEGIVYPPGGVRRVDQLQYISRYFNAVEVNSSFYRPPSARTTAGWTRRVEQPFRFTFKLHQRFTHQRDEPPRSDEVDQFLEGIAPVQQAGMLGCLLLQFPWSFRYVESAFEWLDHLVDAFGRFPLAVEVRHASWDAPQARQKLADLGVSLCNIDQPQLRNCLAPSARVTGPIGYVRFHGRRNDTWFADNIEPHERYNYLYSAEQLGDWVGRIKTMADKADAVYVFANNHFRGQGPANALQLRAMLEQRQVDVPPEMLQHFPFLQAVAKGSSRPGRQMGLFD
jgi:uncharacterized protein YecE (DUF72 family)